MQLSSNLSLKSLELFCREKLSTIATQTARTPRCGHGNRQEKILNDRRRKRSKTPQEIKREK
ncbi:hypothetical protein Taro_025402 [Colocasia esculenta]|uniref:Uncharacterized protein n=1 Tax=Colocasia esculenta TaxID=4460 RepID=A0A843V371_COLES|nr:hypothetical protein [Colocasia esculenta]